MDTQTHVQVLPVEECLRLLVSHDTKLGRIAFDLGDGPMILPINYRLVDGAIVFQTDPGSKLAAVSDGRRLAFEVDEVDVAWRDGWSVVVQGVGRVISEPDRIARVAEAGLVPWAGHAGYTVEIISSHISGRRLT